MFMTTFEHKKSTHFSLSRFFYVLVIHFKASRSDNGERLMESYFSYNFPSNVDVHYFLEECMLL